MYLESICVVVLASDDAGPGTVVQRFEIEATEDVRNGVCAVGYKLRHSCKSALDIVGYKQAALPACSFSLSVKEALYTFSEISILVFHASPAK